MRIIANKPARLEAKPQAPKRREQTGGRQRQGYIYSEMTNKGRRSVRYVRGAKPVYCFRWVGEIQVNGKRYRKRSTDRGTVEFWLDSMRARYADEPIRTGAASPNYHRSYEKKTKPQSDELQRQVDKETVC